MIADLKDLARDLVKASYLKGDFVLRSGKRSNRYFDKFLFETEPALLKRLGAQLAQLALVGPGRFEGKAVNGAPITLAR